MHRTLHYSVSVSISAIIFVRFATQSVHTLLSRYVLRKKYGLIATPLKYETECKW